jgi:anhydro-N-acetylmuramic acid kinase
MLRPLLDRKSLVVLGLNSGTSADGLDLAVIRITRRSGRVSTKFLSGKTMTYPTEIRRLILAAADTPRTSVNEIIQLDNLLGRFYGHAARSYLGQLRRRNLQVDAIASHGQTVRHLPAKKRIAGHDVRGTLQLGSIAQIAAITGKVTVGDFRQGDIALGGEGAPITVAAMADLFASSIHARLIVNVGGMANYFYFPKNGSPRQIRAADCGPGNVLSDLLCRRLYGEPFDRGGHHAAQGKVSRRLLSALLASPYFAGKGRSTGREEFGEAMAGRMLTLGKSLKLGADDLLATAVELTVMAISRAVLPFLTDQRTKYTTLPKCDGLYLTGGGAHNKFLLGQLSERLGGLPVTTVRDLGMDPDLVEATAYAVMGASTLWSRPLATRFDGRSQLRRPVLGVICQPPVAGNVKD